MKENQNFETMERDNGKWGMGMEERAGFGDRLLAAILDFLIRGAVLTLIAWIVYGEFTVYGTNLTDILDLAYLIFVPVVWHGYVIGKRLVGIRIVKESGENVTIGTMLLRVLAGGLIYALTLGIAALVSAFMVGLREDRRAIHDFIAGTYVKKEAG